MGDNTEAVEEFFLGMSADEVFISLSTMVLIENDDEVKYEPAFILPLISSPPCCPPPVQC